MKFDFKTLPGYKVKNKPQLLDFPEHKYLTIQGAGNPNNQDFQIKTETLYASAYGIKMPFKKSEISKKGEYEDYVIPPLEGYWSINEEAIKKGGFTKDDFVYEIRLAVPYFVDDSFISERLKDVRLKKADNKYINDVELKVIPARKVVEILHIGSYDDEPASFDFMQKFIDENNLIRLSKNHVEIYLGDPRKVAPEKLKTILQVEVK